MVPGWGPTTTWEIHIVSNFCPGLCPDLAIVAMGRVNQWTEAHSICITQFLFHSFSEIYFSETFKLEAFQAVDFFITDAHPAKESWDWVVYLRMGAGAVQASW